MLLVFFSVFVNIFSSVSGQADGFPNNPCLTLTDFEIDGDWYAYSQDAVDWSSVLEGTRDTATNSEWRSTQNQCTNQYTRWGYFYKAGIFCDTFDNDETSLLATQNKHESKCCPIKWIPLKTSPMNDKGDLTNAYYVGSDLDLIICAAFERIDINGASYMDLEFNQQVNAEEIDNNPTECSYSAGTDWKCLYPDRIDSDLQISFEIANDITSNVIVISQWDTATTTYKPIRTEDMSTALNSYYYESEDGVFRAAVNNKTIKASTFGRICDEQNYNPDTNPTDCPNIEKIGAFFETCIDFKKMGFYSLHFESLVVKARASPNGAFKDTSGVLYHQIDGPKTYHPSTYVECGLQNTPFPSRAPSVPTTYPTTAHPTEGTSGPTLNPTTLQPSVSPTDGTSNPTTSLPTDSTSGPTLNPSTAPSTAQPTEITITPTTTQPTDSTPGPTLIPTTAQPTDSTDVPTTSNPTESTPAPQPASDSNPSTPTPTPVGGSGNSTDNAIQINYYIATSITFFLLLSYIY